MLLLPLPPPSFTLTHPHLCLPAPVCLLSFARTCFPTLCYGYMDIFLFSPTKSLYYSFSPTIYFRNHLPLSLHNSYYIGNTNILIWQVVSKHFAALRSVLTIILVNRETIYIKIFEVPSIAKYETLFLI